MNCSKISSKTLVGGAVGLATVLAVVVFFATRGVKTPESPTPVAVDRPLEKPAEKPDADAAFQLVGGFPIVAPPVESESESETKSEPQPPPITATRAASTPEELIEICATLEENDVVQLAAGTYPIDESLELLKTATLIGATGDPKDVRLVFQNGTSAVAAATIWLENLTFEGASTLELDESGAATVVNCQFVATGSGIYDKGKGTLTMRKSCVETLDENGAALNLDSSVVRVEDCEFIGQTTLRTRDATFARSSFGNSRKFGVFVDGAVEFDDCVFDRCEFSAIRVAKGASATLRGGTISNSAVGVCVMPGGVCDATGVSFEENENDWYLEFTAQATTDGRKLPLNGSKN